MRGLSLSIVCDATARYAPFRDIKSEVGVMLKLLVISIFTALFALQASAHPGGLDGYRCHTDHKTGTYHCH